MEFSIEPNLVISMDETFLHYVPTGAAYTFAPKGSKQVRLIGADSKAGITVCIATTASGNLPVE